MNPWAINICEDPAKREHATIIVLMKILFDAGLMCINLPRARCELPNLTATYIYLSNTVAVTLNKVPWTWCVYIYIMHTHVQLILLLLLVFCNCVHIHEKNHAKNFKSISIATNVSSSETLGGIITFRLPYAQQWDIHCIGKKEQELQRRLCWYMSWQKCHTNCYCCALRTIQ